MNVAMRLVPDAVLVVEQVILKAAARCRTERADEVLHPALLQRHAVRRIGVVRIVPRDLRVGPLLDAVARSGIPLPVAAGLRAVLRDRIARELAAAAAEL